MRDAVLYSMGYIGAYWPPEGDLVANLFILRFLVILTLAAAGGLMRPFGLPVAAGCAAGAVLALLIVALEWQLHKISLRRLLGAGMGGAAGVVTALFVSLVLSRALPDDNTPVPFIEVAVLLLMTYLGVAIGASKGEMLNLGALGGLFGGEQESGKAYKILDTSVIIDGRIADIAETGFLEGTLVIPQFVLHELQLVADSADSLKRNRGRRGLDILQRIQKMSNINVQIVEDDFPNLREVDMKLIELAKAYNCTIVTNDFNLNKVAQLHGVDVLNINELANAMKPVVLPGESMRVFILKEGKEYNQGVAYLDDGTMVVVDNAKKMISRTIDVSVTSVLQTTAGKMIFGRFDDRIHGVHERPQHGDTRERLARDPVSAGTNPGDAKTSGAAG